MKPGMDEALIPKRRNLTEAVIEALAGRVDAGTYGPGARLPSEQDLCREFGVSRTVVREAVASLRLGGRLYSRQGLGVFVVEKESRPLAFEIKAADDIRSALQILELRLGVEVEAVTLAAARRSPADIAELTTAFDRCGRSDGSGAEQKADADLAFHLAIARATGNPHFPDFLVAVGNHITTDLLIKYGRTGGSEHKSDMARINREHGAILSAITQGDGKAARAAIRHHLEESMVRYRRILSQGTPAKVPVEPPVDRLAS